jgi:excisionase family DNA binding protein
LCFRVARRVKEITGSYPSTSRRGVSSSAKLAQKLGRQIAGPVPRLALSKAEAAEALGVSVDFLEEHVMHELRIVRRGRRRLIPIAELQQWLDRSAARTLGP